MNWGVIPTWPCWSSGVCLRWVRICSIEKMDIWVLALVKKRR